MNLSRKQWVRIGIESVLLAALLGVGVWKSGAPRALMRLRSGKAPSVILLGIDGLSLSTVREMAAAGLLPNFKRVLDSGASGEILTLNPTLSPVIWTTIASGKMPAKHGITGWTMPGQDRVFGSAEVKVKRVWDILSAAKHKSVVVGWFLTSPPSPVHGVLIPDVFYYELVRSYFPKNGVTARGSDGLASTSLASRADLVYPSSVLDRATAAVLGTQLLPEGSDSDWEPILKIDDAFEYRHDESYVRATLDFARENPEFLALYIRGLDEVSHDYGCFLDPAYAAAARRNPAAIQRKLTDTFSGTLWEFLDVATRVVPAYYAYLDTVVGRLLPLMGGDTVLIIASDHGFRYGSCAAFADPTGRVIVSDHSDRATIMAMGKGVEAGGTIAPTSTVADIAPTLLALMGEPAASDMDGKPIEALLGDRQVAWVATFENGRSLARSEPKGPPTSGESEIVKRLRSLGYVQ